MTGKSDQDNGIENKLSVIIGGARDLGYDMAETLASSGSNLVITSRKLEHASAAAGKLRTAFGVKVLEAELDVQDHLQVHSRLLIEAGLQR